MVYGAIGRDAGVQNAIKYDDLIVADQKYTAFIIISYIFNYRNHFQPKGTRTRYTDE